jgi:hypothetical protein
VLSARRAAIAALLHGLSQSDRQAGLRLLQAMSGERHRSSDDVSA